MFEKEIQNFLEDLGADLVGFSNLGESQIKGQNLSYAVTIAVKIPDAILKTIIERPTIEYFHEYRTANTLLDSMSFRLARFIEKKGYNAYPIGASQSDPNANYSGIFSHKKGARLSGLGFIGKNCLLITKEYGSKIRLATVLTDMPVTSQREIIKNGCGDCQICQKACPGGAISGINYHEGLDREEFFSAEKCSHNMKNYKDVGRGAVCGICIKVCPYNKLTDKKVDKTQL